MSNSNQNNNSKFSSLMESFGHLLKPIDIHDWRMKNFNPEEELEIWQCDRCGMDCAGSSISKLCADCETILADAHRDDEEAAYEREITRIDNYFDNSLNC